MSRLTLPGVGTVVHVEGDLEGVYRAAGWVDADQEDAIPEKPKPRRAAKK